MDTAQGTIIVYGSTMMIILVDVLWDTSNHILCPYGPTDKETAFEGLQIRPIYMQSEE